MENVIIDKEICIGCGICVEDCSRKAIDMIDEKAQIDPSLCNGCSHCLAICPVNAVSTPEYEGDILDYDKASFTLDPILLLNSIKFRRSIRQFKVKEIEAEKLSYLIEAGCFSPTAGNRQSNRYIIIKDKIDEVRRLALKALYDVALDTNFDLGGMAGYRNSWIRMYEEYIGENKDRLFFDAPMIIAIVSNDPTSNGRINGAIAASRMELMAYSLGLGTCYIGFLEKAIEFNPKLKQVLDIKDDEVFVLSFVVGYPDVKYRRTVQRKAPNITIC